MVILSVDYGDARTGLAVCDELEMLASPAGRIYESYEPKVIAAVKEVAEYCKAKQIVVGLPRNMDGSYGPRAEKSREFAALLERETGLTPVLWDERRSSVEAHAILHANGRRMKQHRSKVDAVAASLLLEGFLASRGNTIIDKIEKDGQQTKEKEQ